VKVFIPLPYWYTITQAETFSNTSTSLTNNPHLNRRSHI